VGFRCQELCLMEMAKYAGIIVSTTYILGPNRAKRPLIMRVID
jgi:hypothetical protein